MFIGIGKKLILKIHLFYIILRNLLALDCSTQSFKLLVINESRRVEKEIIVTYDTDLPYYNTVNGVIRHNTNGFEHISTPSLLFVEALELALVRLKDTGFNLASVKGISGSGQQHGSVWWKTHSSSLLKQMNDENNNQTLVEIFSVAFSLPMSPIWMDSSTTIECQEITKSENFFLSDAIYKGIV